MANTNKFLLNFVKKRDVINLIRKIINDSSLGQASIITESTTARTLALTDAYKYIRTTNAAATAITIPPNADVAFEIGTQIDFSQQGTGVLSFVAGSGVTINTVSLTMSAQYQAASIVKVDTNEWDLIIG